MPIFYIDDYVSRSDSGYISIDVSDFYNECDDSDIEELKDLLEDYEDWTSKEELAMSLVERELFNAISVLDSNRMRISAEDEETIKRLAERYG